MANRQFRTLAVTLLLAFVASCGSKSFDTRKELWAYLKDTDNKYHIVKSINGVQYELTYKPTDLLVAQELGSQSYTEEKVLSTRGKYQKYLYFQLSISANGEEILNQKAGDRAQFGAMVNQLVFKMDEKVNLITQERDTLPLMDYVTPRMYGMGKSTDLLLVYERDQKLLNQEYLQFTLQDIGFGSGEVTFKLNTKNIKSQPTLNF